MFTICFISSIFNMLWDDSLTGLGAVLRLNRSLILQYDRSTTLFSIEARICPSHIHRVYAYESRTSCLWKKWKGDLLAPSLEIDEPPQVFKICSHMNHSKILKPVRPTVTAYTTNKLVLTLRSNCDKCKTDFELAIQEHGGNIALLIIRWINFGSGLTADDLRWKAHRYNGLPKEPDTLV